MSLTKVSSIILVILLVTAHLSLVTAQTSTALEKAQNDYNFQYSKYRDREEEYITARSSYLSFKTAVAKNDAYVATKIYLDQVVKLYISFVFLTKEHANSFNWGSLNNEKIKAIAILDNQSAALAGYQPKIGSTKTLEQLPPIAADLKTYLNGEFSAKHNKVLSLLEVAETQSTLDEFNSLARILDRVVVFKLRAGETKSILANWASEIKTIRVKTESAIAEARDLNSKTKEDSASEFDLDAITQTIQKAKSELTRSKPLFEEVVRIL